jgi:glycosyltransferase involved in cell wall biosynthesis
MSQSVSVIATVLNEAASIDRLLRSLAGQTRPPDEVVIVDGGSTDGTTEALEAFRRQAPFAMQVLVRPGANISAGRNAAIEAAAGPIIAITDAGVRLEPDWLERLVAPFAAEPAPDVVSGFFVPEYRSLFELALGATTLPRLEELDPEVFYPSSRSVALRREAWAQVGGYPEWLDYCEDLLFDFALRDAGYRFAFAPDAVVHFTPRSSLRAYYRQYYRYARGDGKADFWRYRHALRYGTYLIGGPLLIALALWHPAWLLLGAAGVAAMLRGAIRRLWPHVQGLPWRERAIALAWTPVIRLVGDVAKMLGYPAGIAWRLRHAPPGPWPKRQW